MIRHLAEYRGLSTVEAPLVFWWREGLHYHARLNIVRATDKYSQTSWLDRLCISISFATSVPFTFEIGCGAGSRGRCGNLAVLCFQVGWHW